MPLLADSDVFYALRKQHPVFTYHAFDYKIEHNHLMLTFDFSIGKGIHFRPKTQIPFHNGYTQFYKTTSIQSLENIIFHIGMIELISYWKCCCSPKIIIEAGYVDAEAIAWWKKIYYHGLGEFFYCNHIQTDFDHFVEITAHSTKQFHRQTFTLNDETIVPVGGGKDSPVTLELLKKQHSIPMIINPRQATLACVQMAGYENNFLQINRTIDSTLLDLNAKGYLNGHTPFSAMLAFYSVLLAVLSQKKHIALSNESSANEATVKNMDVNHQYSKSYEFESDFRNYISKYVNTDINYYSFLRPLSELQIAYLFAQLPSYFPVFKSCNVGSKTDIWCGSCSKCLFTYIILSPFIEIEAITQIFGSNLLNNKTLIPVLKELIGESEVKPFECVGTREEVCIALCEACKRNHPLPTLLQYFQSTPLYEQYKDTDFKTSLTRFENKHFLTEDLWMLLISKF